LAPCRRRGIRSRSSSRGFNRALGSPTARELAKEFQVSRTVIREAIRELEVAGFVRIKKGPKGGILTDNAYHKSLSASLRKLIKSGWITVNHILEVRMLIEPDVASQATLDKKERY